MPFLCVGFLFFKRLILRYEKKEWIALFFRKTRLCSINAPGWITRNESKKCSFILYICLFYNPCWRFYYLSYPCLLVEIKGHDLYQKMLRFWSLKRCSIHYYLEFLLVYLLEKGWLKIDTTIQFFNPMLLLKNTLLLIGSVHYAVIVC